MFMEMSQIAYKECVARLHFQKFWFCSKSGVQDWDQVEQVYRTVQASMYTNVDKCTDIVKQKHPIPVQNSILYKFVCSDLFSLFFVQKTMMLIIARQNCLILFYVFAQIIIYFKVYKVDYGFVNIWTLKNNYMSSSLVYRVHGH